MVLDARIGENTKSQHGSIDFPITGPNPRNQQTRRRKFTRVIPRNGNGEGAVNSRVPAGPGA
jgi:hypothetical protein